MTKLINFIIKWVFTIISFHSVMYFMESKEVIVSLSDQIIIFILLAIYFESRDKED